MSRPWQHARTYHEWPSTTPVVDAVIGVVENGLFFVAIGVANALAEVVRRWRRHHG